MRKKEIPNSVKLVGQNIKSIIKEKGLKTRNVANDADLDTEALRRYIAGKQIMGIDKLILIAQAMNVDIADLFKGIYHYSKQP